MHTIHTSSPNHANRLPCMGGLPCGHSHERHGAPWLQSIFGQHLYWRPCRSFERPKSDNSETRCRCSAIATPRHLRQRRGRSRNVRWRPTGSGRTARRQGNRVLCGAKFAQMGGSECAPTWGATPPVPRVAPRAQKRVYLPIGRQGSLSVRCPLRPTNIATLLQLSHMALHFITTTICSSTATLLSPTLRPQPEFTVPLVVRFPCAYASDNWRHSEQVGLLGPQASLVIRRISSSSKPLPLRSSLREGCVQRMYSARALPLLATQPATRRPRPPG